MRKVTPIRAMLATAPPHGVVDIEELGVEKHMLPRPRQPLGKRDAAGEDQLQAHLVEGDRLAEALHHRLGRGNARDVEGNDQAVAGRNCSHGAISRGTAGGVKREGRRASTVWNILNRSSPRKAGIQP